MEFVIGGRIYSIDSLEEDLDQAFIDLHAAFLGDNPLSWDSFKTTAKDFFDKHHQDNKITSGYFRGFTILWRNFLQRGLWDKAEHIWKIALEPAIEWEDENRGKRIHKGGPYYFWGMTVIERGDLDRGYALMHQALEEDVLSSGKKFPDTPAFAFATLDYGKVDQAFRQEVLKQADYISQRITKYNNDFGSDYSLDQFKSCYLKSPPSIDAIYLLAYTISRFIRLDKLPKYLRASPFAGQLIQNLLFDLVQVIDESIANINDSKWKMIDHINFISKEAKQLIPKKKLQEINGKFIENFDSISNLVLDNDYRFDEDESKPTKLQSDLLIVYGLRNRGAHKIKSSKILWKRYKEFRDAVFNTLILISEFLY